MYEFFISDKFFYLLSAAGVITLVTIVSIYVDFFRKKGEEWHENGEI